VTPYEAALRQQLPDSERLIVLDTVDSTNTYAKMLAQQGAVHGTIVIADGQTAGRGRMGRKFASAKGLGLYCSVILRPQCTPDQLMRLTIFAAEAARRAIREVFAVDAGIKWINDLVFGGKKLCGILTELGFTDGHPDYAVVGIGINCNQKAEDFPEEISQIATSLRQILGREVHRAPLAEALLRQLNQGVEAMATNPMPWLDLYRANCLTIGQDVQLLQNDTVRQAHAVGMDDQGALLVTLPDGTQEHIYSGEVSVRGLYGYVTGG
jgi:BirA family biotin operon repressor/biotin-[acetyl-CoA-carboxylase] ligase